VPQNIRVAIQTTGFAGFAHETVRFSSVGGMTVSYGGEVINVPAGSAFEVTNALFGTVNRVYAVPLSGGKITLESVRRNYPDSAAPSYRGVFEVSKAPDGAGFYIVNEVCIEEYLYAVIPSEMPTAFGLEAAKAQAVTARSYARTQFFANRYHRYGANVDDSVMCQVYNNIPETETSITATRETEGLCLAYRGNVIAANFFSTSGGMTANSGEVWAGGGVFPSTTPEYLRAAKQYLGNVDYGDLRIEENARAFYTATDIDSFDSHAAWFRWNVEMTAAQLSTAINASLQARYNANPRLIKTLQPNNSFLSRPVSTIGTLVDIEVLERGEAGNVLVLKLVGSEATVTVATEFNIRTLLSPARAGSAEVRRHNGSSVSNSSILPSAFFVMDKSFETAPLTGESVLSSVTFFGGGNGHGVGMSQNGVKGMIDRGFGYEEILAHFYAGTEIVKP